jgi:hypothetical protein
MVMEMMPGRTKVLLNGRLNYYMGLDQIQQYVLGV